MYEFLLRALNNGCNIYSIPKIGYKHLSTRENSMFDSYAKTRHSLPGIGPQSLVTSTIAVRRRPYQTDREVCLKVDPVTGLRKRQTQELEERAERLHVFLYSKFA